MAYQGAAAAPVFQSAAYAYQQTAQQPGLLQTGQIINVNGIIVTVERYLSQGGFAHVYVVQSQTPISGTRQHVLKRMAVPDESMLREVKKEVDVMKLLRGHPNIVNFIEASSQPMGNGAHEVFILMEFCPGGGIIDMMNRRLRERLTESEILTIFVNVCEGLACMHNLKPPLLHRDLKVENILQASATSYKLCDFGSSTPTATRAPSTAAELRALEHDLNRHTTLQYRAPEMVDVYLRRPVDEKSDIWALGVLLYKLCYYTTPFEEHGPLAILNVSYRTPPYPVYSTQMNGLIGSMLREHGAQRPSVFDLLDAVHRMRGTQSKFRYNRASSVPQPLPSAASHDVIWTRQRPSVTSAAAADTRKEEASQLAPPRRGRPSQGQTLIPSPIPLSPIKSGPSKITEAPPRLPPVRMEVTRLLDQESQKVTSPPTSSLSPEWASLSSSAVVSTSTPTVKFDNKFDSVSISSTLGTGKPGPLLSSLDAVPPSARIPALPSRGRATPPARLNPHHRTGPTLNMMNRPRDAFENLNSAFPLKPLPMTLGSQMLANASAAATAAGATNSGSLDAPGGGAGVRSPSAPYAPSPNQAAINHHQQQQPPGSPRLPPRPRENTLVPSDAPADERFPSIEVVESRFSPQPPPIYTSNRGRDRESRPASPTKRAASSTSAGSLQPPSTFPRQPSPSRNTSQQHSQSPSRSAYRPLPPSFTPSGPSSSQHSTPLPHPQGPRARSPPVPNKDVSISAVSSGTISLSEAGGRLSSTTLPVNATVPSMASVPAPSLPPRPVQSTGAGATTTPAPGSRFTMTNGTLRADGFQSPDAIATRPPAKREAPKSGATSDASTSSAASAPGVPGAPLLRRSSMQARPSYMHTPTSPNRVKPPMSGITAAAAVASAVKTTTQPIPPQKPRDWLTGEDDPISDLGATNAAATALAVTTATPKHERRSSRTVSSPRKDTREGAMPSAIPSGPFSSSSFTGGGSAHSPRKSVLSPGAGVPSTPVRSAGTGLLSTRSDTHLSADSSDGEDGPEEATPNAGFTKRKSFIPPPSSSFSLTNQTRSSQPQQSSMSPSRPATSGGKDLRTLREESARESYLKTPSLAQLTGSGSGPDADSVANSSRIPEKKLPTAGVGSSKRQSVQDIVDAMRASAAASASGGIHSSSSPGSPNRTPRKQASTQDLIGFDSTGDRDSRPPSSPVRNATSAAAARNRKARGGEMSHLRAGSINTTFTAAVVNPMTGLSPSPASLRPPSGPTTSSGSRKPIQGGPRTRPQSLFLPSPSSETYLRPPSAEPSPNSESSSPSSTNADKSSRARRLSISDMVHKFEAMNSGDLPPVGIPFRPREGGGRRVPSGAGAYIHPKTTGSGSGSKPSAAGIATNTMETSQGTGKVAHRSGRSPVSPVESSFESRFHQEAQITSSGLGATSSSSTLKAPASHQTQPRAPSPTWFPRSESPHQTSASEGGSGPAAEASQLKRRKHLNTVSPTDSMGPASSSSDMMSSASVTAASPRAGGPPPPSAPERPYQGVGKLIAEWHKKSEANNNNPLPAHKVSGRAGLR